MKKTLLTATLLTATLLGTQVYAGDKPEKGDCHGRDKHHGEMGHMGFGGKDMLTREFTPEQIRTLMEARLLMKGNPNVQVGDIKATKDGYSVNIVTKDKSLVETLDIAKNGLPKDMSDRMQARMQEKQAQQPSPTDAKK